MSISIPGILQDGSFRFIRLKKKQKEPLDNKWQTDNNFSFDDPKIISHLENGGNYGVICSDNDVCILDADEYQRLKEIGALELFEDTFTVRTGNDKGERYHYYFRCKGLGRKKIPFYDLNDEKLHLGELYPTKSPAYCVCVNSVHPSGNTYDIVCDKEIKTILLSELESSFLHKVKSNFFHINQEPPADDTKKDADQKNTRKKSAGKLKKIGEGGRYNEIISHIGFLFNKGLRGNDLLEGAFEYNKTVCNPPLSEDEVTDYVRRTAGWNEPQTLKSKDDTRLSWHSLGLSDLGNADRFLKKYGDKFLFSPSEKNAWYFWDGKIWQQDKASCVKRSIIEVVKTIYAEARYMDDEKDRKRVGEWAIRSESERSRHAMLSSISHALAVDPDKWNNQPNLLNLLNGTLELDTLKFRSFRRDDFLTMKAGVKYDPKAKCPEWIDHLSFIFGMESKNQQEKEQAPDLIEAFQLMAGYSLLSGNPDQVFFILHGGGENGKSVTLTTIRTILGDYATHITPKTLMQQQNPDKARSDLVRLQYKRLVTSSESKKGERLDVGLIKELSGGEPIVARDLFKSEIQFKAEFTIFFSTNPLPIINDASHSIWRRLWLIPFNQKIPAERKIPDYEKKLVESEGSGILNWMIEGLQKYYEKGHLVKPKAIQDATDEYKEDEDPLGDYMKLRIIEDPNSRETSSDIYSDYMAWCAIRSIKYPISKRSLSVTLMDHGFKPYRNKHTRGFEGLKLVYNRDGIMISDEQRNEKIQQNEREQIEVTDYVMADYRESN